MLFTNITLLRYVLPELLDMFSIFLIKIIVSLLCRDVLATHSTYKSNVILEISIYRKYPDNIDISIKDKCMYLFYCRVVRIFRLATWSISKGEVKFRKFSIGSDYKIHRQLSTLFGTYHNNNNLYPVSMN